MPKSKKVGALSSSLLEAWVDEIVGKPMFSVSSKKKKKSGKNIKN